MTIDPGTGIVTWPNPIASGTLYPITIEATDANGEVDARTWNLKVKPGDFNGDGVTDTLDLPTFANHLLGLDNSHPCAADVNNDGNIDGLDVQAWIAASQTP